MKLLTLLKYLLISGVLFGPFIALAFCIADPFSQGAIAILLVLMFLFAKELTKIDINLKKEKNQ